MFLNNRLLNFFLNIIFVFTLTRAELLANFNSEGVTFNNLDAILLRQKSETISELVPNVVRSAICD